MSGFATYLKGLLSQRNWDQSRLALEAGLPPSTISDLINKPKKERKISTLIKVANALEVDLQELMEQAGYPMRRSPTRDDFQRRLARVVSVAPWAEQLVETVVELPETEQDQVVSFAESLMERQKNQKSQR